MGYEVVIPARNEEKYLEKTLHAIRRQSIAPKKIIVVNDGATDRTSEIAKKYADIVVELSDRGFNAIATAAISGVINQGLTRVSPDSEYILICGADAVLPTDFFEVISKEMEINPRLVVASGRLESDPTYKGLPPRGTRVVRADFWREANGLRYPETPGWESWLVFKALEKDMTVKRVPHLITGAQRSPIKTKIKKARSIGASMSNLGYFWVYALGRSFRYFLSEPKAGIDMLSGFLSARGLDKMDVAPWVNNYQKRNLVKSIINFFTKNGIPH
jgi:glycosyltransferase involved in cell wall biosynthesis